MYIIRYIRIKKKILELEKKLVKKKFKNQWNYKQTVV